VIPGIIGFLSVLIFSFFGMPIAFSLFIVGFGGIFLLRNITVANSAVALIPWGTLMGSDLGALPLFILIGSLTMASGVVRDAYEVARRWLGKLHGGLGLATMAASAVFAACAGASVAAAASIGKMAIPEMKKYGYSGRLATGTCAAGGLLATMIPPSIAMVIYGLAAFESIGHLLIAGVFPGLLLALFFGGGIYMAARINPAAAPLAEIDFTWRERFAGIPKLWGIIIIFSTVFFGLMFGLVTATEAAAWGSFVAFLLVITRQRGGSWKAIIEAFRDCALITCMIFFLIMGAFVFSNFVIQAGLPRQLSALITAVDVPPVIIILCMLAIYIVLGMFLETTAMMLITIPIFHPIIIGLGYSGIWFGVLVVMMVEVGLVTPPFGVAVYVLDAVAPDVGLPEIFKGALMFVGLELMVLILVLFFPQIALWLPAQVR